MVTDIGNLDIGKWQERHFPIMENGEYRKAQCFVDDDLQEIRLGVEKKLDVSLYTNYLFNHAQMREIRLGLEAGLDVSLYSSLVYSATDMKEKRRAVISQKRITGGADSMDAAADGTGEEQKTEMGKDIGPKVTREDIYQDLERR